jgi:Mg2+ and Co2+ transporter CorA
VPLSRSGARLGRLHTDRRLVALYRLLDALVDTMFPYLIRISDMVDSYRDLLSGSLDAYMSMVSTGSTT